MQKFGSFIIYILNAPAENDSTDSKTTLKVLDLTNLPFDIARIKLLCRGFSFTPTPGPNEIEINSDLKDFSRKLRLREFFLDSYREPRLVSNKSDFTPPKERDQELDEIVEDIMKMNIQTKAAKDNITKAERVALQQLKVNKDIVIKEADKGGVIVIMTKEQYKSMAMKHLNSNSGALWQGSSTKN